MIAAGPGQRPRKIVLAGAPQEGEPRSEISLDHPSFSLAAIVTRVFYCKERSLIYSYGYICRSDTETSSVCLYCIIDC